jgi:hypothetical protein
MTNDHTAAEADALWRKQLGPLLTVTATASELGIPAKDVEQMIEAKELLALPAGDGVLLPAFQFSDGKPLPGLKEILTVFTPVVKTPFTVASWFTGPQPELEQQTPAAWLRDGRDPRPAILAARRSAALLAQ